MDKKLFKELESNLKEAARVASGEMLPRAAYVVLRPADIKAIRAGTGMSQAQFAQAFRLSIETIKGWEQGKRRPDAASTNYLRIIEADPGFVQQTLAA